MPIDTELVWPVASQIDGYWETELELLHICLRSMQRVWSKEQDEWNERREYKHFKEMGDVLYHATNGQQGACGKYDLPPCKPWPEAG